MEFQLINTENVYLFKFKKMPYKEVENIMLQTLNYFEVYVPYEKSNFEYIIGSVFSEDEVKSLSKYFEENEIELKPTTREEFNNLKYLVGIECDYFRNIQKDL